METAESMIQLVMVGEVKLMVLKELVEKGR
jgi:hypothetical protein